MARAQRDRLRALSHGLRVEFFDYVDDARKGELMHRAHALFLQGIRESWSMAITEANACGPPAIAYNIVGYRDAIRDGETGILTEQTPHAMARASIRLIRDADTQRSLCAECIELECEVLVGSFSSRVSPSSGAHCEKYEKDAHWKSVSTSVLFSAVQAE